MELKKNIFNRSKWTGLRSAIQFLTIIPCGRGHDFNARAALPFFPLCGLLIGVLLVMVDTMAALVWPRPIVALLDVIALAAISGALHLDGVADTADGLYGHREPEQALAIMKDSRIGAMGSIAVLFCLAAKWAGLAHVNAHQNLWLLLVPAYARSAVLFGTKILPYGRSKEGTGHSFFNEPIRIKDFWGLLVLVPLSLFTPWSMLGLNLGFAIILGIILTWYFHKIRCITGDMLGALIEWTETGLFLIAAVKWGV